MNQTHAISLFSIIAALTIAFQGSLMAKKSPSFQSYCQSILDIRASRDHSIQIGNKKPIEVFELDTSNENDQILLDSMHKINQLVFGDKNLLEIVWFEGSDTSLRHQNGKSFVAFGIQNFKDILEYYPLSMFSWNNQKNIQHRIAVIQWILAHEVGHYLQHLHYHLFGHHLSIDIKHLSDEYKALPLNARNKLYKTFHLGTDNYAFAIMDMLGWKYDQDLIGYLTKAHPAPGRRQNAQRRVNGDIKCSVMANTSN